MSERGLVEYITKQNQQPPKPRPIRIAAVDTGRQKDRTATVGIEIPDRWNINIIGARQAPAKQAYEESEEEIENIHRSLVKRPFDVIGVETNNAGWHVYESLKSKYLPVIPINTVGTIKDKKKLRDLVSMDKTDTVHYAKRLIQQDRVYFPSHGMDSPGTIALKNQMPKFTKKLTEGGKLTYSAQGREHDDLVMALLICIHIARKRVFGRTSDFGIVTRNYKPMTKSIRQKELDNIMPESLGKYARITSITKSGPT